MAVVLVQSQHKDSGTGASTTVAFSALTSTTAGTLLIAMLHTRSASPGWSGPAGWTQRDTKGVTNGNVSLWELLPENNAGGATAFTFTCTSTGNAGNFGEFSGILNPTGFDVDVPANGTTTAISDGPATPAATGELALFGTTAISANTQTWTAPGGANGTGWLQLSTLLGTLNTAQSSDYYALDGGTGATTATSTLGFAPTSNWEGILAFYKAGGAVVASVAPLQPYVFRRGGFYQPQFFRLLLPPPFDAAVPDRPPLTPYVFRRGGYFQPQRIWLFPTPFDAAIPDQPPIPQYILRPGGYFQPQKLTLLPRPFDPPIPDQPVVRAYVFRPGGFYRPQIFLPVQVVVVPFDPAIPDRPLVPQYVFRPGGYYRPQRFWLFPIPGGLIAGQTQTTAGVPLPFCTVHLFLTATDQIVATTTSDGSANYAFTISNSGGPYYLVAYLPGSPDVAGTTVNTLIPN